MKTKQWIIRPKIIPTLEDLAKPYIVLLDKDLNDDEIFLCILEQIWGIKE